MSGARPARGVAWGLSSATMSAAFMVPWKLASELGDPATVVLLMLVSAALFNTALLGARRAGTPRLNRTTVGVAMLLAVFTLVGNLASAAAVARISGALLSVLQRAEVIVVALLAWAFVGERVDRRYWLGALVACGGFWVIRGAEVDQVTADGLLYGLASAVCFSAMAVLTRKYITRVDPASLNALRVWLSVLAWLVVYGPPPGLSALPPRLISYAALAGLCGPGLSRLFLMFSARDVEARITSLLTLCAPVLTLVFAWALLGDWPGPRELLGGAIMLCGIGLPVVAMLRAVRTV